MKKLFLFFLVAFNIVNAQLPKPDHIVIVIFENKDYSQIVGSSEAPYINSLLKDTNSAILSQYYALTHPSQPNYLMLYSGSNQGVTDDNVSRNTPFTTCNLGASLLSAGFTFTGYCESMPSAGYLGSFTTLYYRKHNPWSNWQGTQFNQVPALVNQPFTNFPADYSLLPHVSFVIPNIVNCMHNGTIHQGDSWLKANLEGYIKWAQKNNSLLILTFDEDDGNENNHILTFFNGPMVKAGSYKTHANHFNLLRTIEDIYSLKKCGNSANSSAIDYVWKGISVGLNENHPSISNTDVKTITSNGQMIITINSPASIENVNISLTDLSGRISKKKIVELKPGENRFDFDTNGLSSGVYLINIAGKEINYNYKIIID